MPSVTVRPAAEVDLLLVWDFIAVDSPDAADLYLRWLTGVLELIATQPLMGKARAELLPDLRSFAARNHLIFYTPVADGIVVERVLDGRQNIGPDLFT